MRAPTYKTIVDELVEGIRSGAVRPGERLPTHRELARDRGVATATATRVYTALKDMGLVAGEAGRGMFVQDRSDFSGAAASRRLPVERYGDLSFNQPLADGQVDGLRHELRELAASGDLEELLRQQPPGGRTRDRAVVATHLLGHGIDVAPRNVVLTGGGQHGLDTVLRSITRRGDVLAVDALTYPGIPLLAAPHGLELAPVPAGPLGPDLDALESLCAARKVRAIYTIPTVHNPLGWVLDREQRARIVALARTHDLVIIEDATYAFLEPLAPPPLQAMAPERTCHVGSVSKNLATGLRFGYAVIPDDCLRAVTTALRASMWGLPSLTTVLACRWIADGTLARLEEQRRVDAAARQRIAASVLSGRDYTAHPASYGCWLRLGPHVRMDALTEMLAEVGILVATADAFATGREKPHALRIALAGPPVRELEAVLARFRDVLDSFPP